MALIYFGPQFHIEDAFAILEKVGTCPKKQSARSHNTFCVLRRLCKGFEQISTSIFKKWESLKGKVCYEHFFIAWLA